ncbi:MAG: deaminase [Candidatus Paceibacterota bacterium]
MRVVIAYVPVIHSGYLKFFEKYSDADQIYIFGGEIIDKFDYLRKEIRAIAPEEAKVALERLLGREIIILDLDNLSKLTGSNLKEIIAHREDVTEELLTDHFLDTKITYDNIFLRWNRENATKKIDVSPGTVIEADKFTKEILGKAFEVAEGSSDWWLQVGAVVVRDEQVILCGHNRGDQSRHQVWSEGDPRNCFWQGVNIDLSTSLHAERVVISEAARKGIALEGASLYVTHFPCPTCAKAVASAGIKKLYYAQGYAVIDGQSALENKGVEIIKVNGIDALEKGDEFIPYSEKKKASA